MFRVDLNSDLGESYGRYTIGMDERIIPLVTSANVACGYHASDPVVMQKTVREAKKAGIGVGAHPGFPDLMGFGRREMAVSPAEAKAYTLYQLGALAAFCQAENRTHGIFLRLFHKTVAALGTPDAFHIAGPGQDGHDLLQIFCGDFLP